MRRERPLRGLKRMATPRLRAAGSKAKTDLRPCCSRMSPTSSWSCVYPPSCDRKTATGRPRRNSCTSSSGAAPDPGFPSEEGAVAGDSSWMASSLVSAATAGAGAGAAALSASDSISIGFRGTESGALAVSLVFEIPRC